MTYALLPSPRPFSRERGGALLRARGEGLQIHPQWRRRRVADLIEAGGEGLTDDGFEAAAPAGDDVGMVGV